MSTITGPGLAKTFNRFVKEAKDELNPASYEYSPEEAAKAAKIAIKLARTLETTSGWDESLSRDKAISDLQELFTKAVTFANDPDWGVEATQKVAKLTTKLADAVETLNKANR
jgi:hypothetical protein